jgi:archaellum biogenesis protein FlaJ (TadC family)
MTLTSYLVSKQKFLKKRLRMAKVDQTPEQYVQKAFKTSVMFGFATAFFVFIMMSKSSPHIITPLLIGFLVAYGFFKMNMKKVDVLIRKRAKEIDKEVLFAGRFLLIKLNSGKPLVNALEEASSGFGAATEYFQDIMREIHMGTPLEEALDKGTEYCPSERLKKILFQITNALKIGVDVTNFLEAILDEIAEEELTDILRYGKKLSSLTMFYMLGAVIVPSLGMTLFVVIASLISIKLDMVSFTVIVVLLAVLQFVFITLFRSARPNMDV